MTKRIRVKSGIDILVGKMVSYNPNIEHSNGDVIINVQKNSFNYGTTMIDKDSRFSDKVNWKKVDLETVEIKPVTGVKRMIAKIKKLHIKHKEFCIGEKNITFFAIGDNEDGEATIINWKVSSLDTDEIHVELVSIAKGDVDSYYEAIDYEDLSIETIDSILDALNQYDIEWDKYLSNQHYANL